MLYTSSKEMLDTADLSIFYYNILPAKISTFTISINFWKTRQH